MATCRSCSAEIIWCETSNGKAMPVDFEPDPNGNVELVQRTAHWPLAIVHPQPPMVAADLHQSHFATCAHANAHRRPR